MVDARRRPLVPVAYATGAVFALYFLTGAVTDHRCLGNYVIFQIAPGTGWLYELYYYGWLLVGMGLAWYLGRRVSKSRHRALTALMVGYASFIIPTAATYLMAPSVLAGIPSIMCGFGVFMALVVSLYALPRSAKPRH